MLSGSDFARKVGRANEYFTTFVGKYKGEFLDDEVKVRPGGYSRHVAIGLGNDKRVAFDAELGWNESVWSAEIEHQEMFVRYERQRELDRVNRLCVRCKERSVGVDGTGHHCRQCADGAKERMKSLRSDKASKNTA